MNTLTVDFLYLAFLYLAEAIIIMPSPRNHILDFLNLAAALSGNGQSAKSKFFFTIASLIPKLKIRPRQRPTFEFKLLDFASYQYYFNTKVQKSSAPATEL